MLPVKHITPFPTPTTMLRVCGDQRIIERLSCLATSRLCGTYICRMWRICTHGPFTTSADTRVSAVFTLQTRPRAFTHSVNGALWLVYHQHGRWISLITVLCIRPFTPECSGQLAPWSVCWWSVAEIVHLGVDCVPEEVRLPLPSATDDNRSRRRVRASHSIGSAAAASASLARSTHAPRAVLLLSPLAQISSRIECKLGADDRTIPSHQRAHVSIQSNVIQQRPGKTTVNSYTAYTANWDILHVWQHAKNIYRANKYISGVR